MHSITLDLDHPSKKRTEYFLNALPQELVPTAIDWRHWSCADQIIGAFKFSGKDQQITVTVVFADSYQDANEVAAANSFFTSQNIQWTVNGDVLYLVESKDEDRRSEFISFFAGEE